MGVDGERGQGIITDASVDLLTGRVGGVEDCSCGEDVSGYQDCGRRKVEFGEMETGCCSWGEKKGLEVVDQPIEWIGSNGLDNAKGYL